MRWDHRKNYCPQELAKVPEAPVYRPSAEEFRDPMTYIRSIWSEAAKSGIIKIIPPPGWKSGASNTFFDDSLSFSTRLQDVHKLRHRFRGVNERFRAYVEQHVSTHPGSRVHVLQFPPVLSFTNGRPVDPTSDKWQGTTREVDLYQLYLAVVKRNGLAVVSGQNLWQDIAADLRLPITDPELLDELEDIFVSYLAMLPSASEVLANFPPPPEFGSFGNATSSVSDPASPGVPLPLNNSSSSSTASTTPSVDGVAQTSASGMHRSVRNDFCAVCCFECKKRFVDETSGETEEFVTCWQCGLSSHRRCFDGKLRTSEDGSDDIWLCNGDCSYGFESGETFTLKQYRSEAESFKRIWMQNFVPPDGSPVAWQDIEAEYWKIVEDPTRAVYVRYGSDLDTNRTGSGFPCSRNNWSSQARSQVDENGLSRDNVLQKGSHLSSSDPDTQLSTWNLNILPSVRGSLLKYFRDSIKGINVPWLYCGSLFSTFCYHAEDLNMMSINYMHQSDPGGGKVWYGVPPGDGALMFEAALRTAVPELFRSQPNLQYELVTMVSPVELMTRGASICRTVQRPGEFILTFPQSFHGGFSLGYNIAEAVNFFTPECFPWMRAGVRNAHVFKRSPVFCYVEFMVQLGARLGVHPDLSVTDVELIADELERIERKAKADRSKLITGLWGQYENVSKKFNAGDVCSRCEQHCSLSVLQRIEDSSLFCLDCVVEDLPEFVRRRNESPETGSRGLMGSSVRYLVEDFLSTVHLQTISRRVRKAALAQKEERQSAGTDETPQYLL